MRPSPAARPRRSVKSRQVVVGEFPRDDSRDPLARVERVARISRVVGVEQGLRDAQSPSSPASVTGLAALGLRFEQSSARIRQSLERVRQKEEIPKDARMKAFFAWRAQVAHSKELHRYAAWMCRSMDGRRLKLVMFLRWKNYREKMRRKMVQEDKEVVEAATEQLVVAAEERVRNLGQQWRKAELAIRLSRQRVAHKSLEISHRALLRAAFYALRIAVYRKRAFRRVVVQAARMRMRPSFVHWAIFAATAKSRDAELAAISLRTQIAYEREKHEFTLRSMEESTAQFDTDEEVEEEVFSGGDSFGNVRASEPLSPLVNQGLVTQLRQSRARLAETAINRESLAIQRRALNSWREHLQRTMERRRGVWLLFRRLREVQLRQSVGKWRSQACRATVQDIRRRLAQTSDREAAIQSALNRECSLREEAESRAERALADLVDAEDRLRSEQRRCAALDAKVRAAETRDARRNTAVTKFAAISGGRVHDRALLSSKLREWRAFVHGRQNARRVLHRVWGLGRLANMRAAFARIRAVSAARAMREREENLRKAQELAASLQIQVSDLAEQLDATKHALQAANQRENIAIEARNTAMEQLADEREQVSVLTASVASMEKKNETLNERCDSLEASLHQQHAERKAAIAALEELQGRFDSTSARHRLCASAVVGRMHEAGTRANLLASFQNWKQEVQHRRALQDLVHQHQTTSQAHRMFYHWKTTTKRSLHSKTISHQNYLISQVISACWKRECRLRSQIAFQSWRQLVHHRRLLNIALTHQNQRHTLHKAFSSWKSLRLFRHRSKSFVSFLHRRSNQSTLSSAFQNLRSSCLLAKANTKWATRLQTIRNHSSLQRSITAWQQFSTLHQHRNRSLTAYLSRQSRFQAKHTLFSAMRLHTLQQQLIHDRQKQLDRAATLLCKLRSREAKHTIFARWVAYSTSSIAARHSIRRNAVTAATLSNMRSRSTVHATFFAWKMHATTTLLERRSKQRQELAATQQANLANEQLTTLQSSYEAKLSQEQSRIAQLEQSLTNLSTRAHQTQLAAVAALATGHKHSRLRHLFSLWRSNTRRAIRSHTANSNVLEVGVPTPSKDILEAGAPTPSKDILEAGAPTPSKDILEAGAPTPSKDILEAGAPTPSKDILEAGAPTPSKDILEVGTTTPSKDILEVGATKPSKDISSEPPKIIIPSIKVESRPLPPSEEMVEALAMAVVEEAIDSCLARFRAMAHESRFQNGVVRLFSHHRQKRAFLRWGLLSARSKILALQQKLATLEQETSKKDESELEQEERPSPAFCFPSFRK